MSELKTHKMIDEKYCDDSFCVVPSDVYLKSEADKVIEELKHQRDGAFGLANSGLTLDDLSQMSKKEIDRQKYKRCLVMAKWCNERYILDDCLYNLGKTRFYERWENRWRELAEQFKEAK